MERNRDSSGPDDSAGSWHENNDEDGDGKYENNAGSGGAYGGVIGIRIVGDTGRCGTMCSCCLPLLEASFVPRRYLH